jgi:eukaryotic-like serine/threonine-protein kinase
MGVVYLARTAEGAQVALKTLQGVVGDLREESGKRFWREARATSAIQHPGVVRLLDAGADGDIPYLVMELLDGNDLSAAIQRNGALDPALTARLFVQACEGLAALHAQQVVHRDIKPSNIFLHRDPSGLLVTKICDLGIAKHEPASGAYATELTHTGGLLGSPAYMSPEQVQDSKRVDHRTDIWSLCASMYEALCGQKCWYSASNVGEMFVAICTRDAPSLAERAPWLDRRLCEVIHRGLRREREERYASASELALALEPFAAPASALPAARLAALADTPTMATARHGMLGGGSQQAQAAPAQTKAHSRTGRWWVAGSAAVTLGAAAVAFLGRAHLPLGNDAAASGPRSVASGGLERGSHACMMIDGTGSYNRVCTVQQEGDGPLKVRAPGTSLNPRTGFDFTATGGPGAYEAQGQMRAFDSCTGPFAATTTMQSTAGIDWYVLRFKHCKIMVRKSVL